MGARRTARARFRRAPYNLRSRSKVPNYLETLTSASSAANKNKSKADAPLPLVKAVQLNEDTNTAAHHTELYDKSLQPVFRRGQAVEIEIQFDRPLKDDENAALIVTSGRHPMVSKGTFLTFAVKEKTDRFGWTCEPSTKDNQTFILMLIPSARAVIGTYDLSTHMTCEHRVVTKRLKDNFTLIFNPWCEKDDVYMPDAAERDEYILNESGRIWVGNRHRHYGKPWTFGQFQKCALEAALYVLDISDLSDGAMSNPVIVARTFTKMVNSFDDDGILEGNWTGDYRGGVEPTDWISSVDILNEYLETKQEVKYGQCWVFSGLMTTLLRAVGIPVRSVTNFESAHDNDVSMTVDRHWDENDKPLEDLNDSIWNFHVWNECWCLRQDLPDGCDGWQAIDATPQERSEGVMQCGPASVKAIRQGDVYLQHDSKFIFAEVNGDIIEWLKTTNGEMKPVWKQPHSIGFNISTKAVGSPVRHDITDHYKYPEGSTEEREVVSRVTKYSSRQADLKSFYRINDKEDVDFNLYGTGHSSGNIDIILEMNSSKAAVVDIVLTVVASYYHGLTGDELKVDRQTKRLSSGQKSEVSVLLLGKDYLNKIATDASISVFCKATVKGTGQFFFKKETFSIDRPDLIVSTPSSIEQGSMYNVDVAFTNPLSIPLTECRLMVDVPGATIPRAIKLPSSIIASGATIHQTVSVAARTAGVKEVITQLHTRQLQNITGVGIITVKAK